MSPVFQILQKLHGPVVVIGPVFYGPDTYPGTRIHMGDSLLKVPVETRHSMAMLIEGDVRLMS